MSQLLIKDSRTITDLIDKHNYTTTIVVDTIITMQILTILFILLQIYTLAASLSPPPTDEWGDYNGLDLIDVSNYNLCYISLFFLWIGICFALYSYHVSNLLCKPLKFIPWTICYTSSQWINAHPDGDIHTSVRIGRERPGDSTSINGLFVKEPFSIEKGDIIAQIPWD